MVFHLNGHDGDPQQRQHLVLSEDDYLSHLVRLSRDQQTLLPTNIPEMLAQSGFLFLGYNLEDWDFRLILHGLLAPTSQDAGSRKSHVAVQLEVGQNPNAARAIEYLESYLGRRNIKIYWGTAQQFVTELHARWQEFLPPEAHQW